MKSIAKFGKVGMFLGVAAAFVTTISTVQPAEARDFRDSRDFGREARIEARIEAHREAMAAQQYACAQNQFGYAPNQFGCAQNQFGYAPVGYQVNRPSLVSNLLWRLGL